MQKKRVDKNLFNFGYKCQNFSQHISRLDYIGWFVSAKALDAVHIWHVTCSPVGSLTIVQPHSHSRPGQHGLMPCKQILV